MFIQARLKWTGATLTYTYNKESDQVILTDIENGLSIAADIRLCADKYDIYPFDVSQFVGLSQGDRDLLKLAQDPAARFDELDSLGILESARPYFDLLYTAAGNLGGIATGKSIQLQFHRHYKLPPIFKDIVRDLTIGTAPYVLR